MRLLLLVIASLGTLAMSHSSSAAPRPKPPYRVLYNNDTTNIRTCTAPWGEKGGEFTDDKLRATIDEAKGVDVHLLSPGLGWIPWWPSKVYPDPYQWWQERTGLELDTFGKYMVSGGDMLKVFVEHCRQVGVASFVSYRINDVHHQEAVAKVTPQSIWVSRFYQHHLEYLLQPEHLRRQQGYHAARGHDWAIPEVREHKFELMREVILNYDLDGFEIDMMRSSAYFRPDMTPDEAARIIVGYCRRLRGVMDEKQEQTGKRMWFSLRIPSVTRLHPGMGLDLPALYDAGVDIFNLGDMFHATQTSEVAKVRALVPHAAVYLEMTHSSGSHNFAGKDKGYQTYAFPRTSVEQLQTTAHHAYSQGADGVSLFNFVYYRSHGGGDPCGPIMEPPFDVLPRLAKPEWLAAQPQYYWLGQGSWQRQVPRALAPGKAEVFTLSAAPREDADQPGRLRLHSREPIPENATITVTLNGQTLAPTEDESAFYDNPFDGMLSDAPRRRAWTVPAALLTKGDNNIRVTLEAGPELRLEWLDLALP